MQTTVTVSQQEIAEALALIEAYYNLYGQVATDTLALLQAIEQDLNSIAQSLNQMSQILAQGAAAAQQSLSQLQAAASKASAAMTSALTKQKTWTNTVKTELTKRANTALQTKPTSIPTDWRSTVQSVASYADTVRSALGDNKITKSEVSAISVAGANATAGLKQFGGTQFDSLVNSINTMTTQIARGELPKAKSGLAGLEQSTKSLPTLPSKPSRR